jgi:hypothetical protein
MNYGRETVSNLLRKAGQGIMDFDRMYAERAARDMKAYDTPMGGIRGMLGGNAIGDIAKGFDSDSLGERLVGYGMQTGMIATNAGYRYGLPAAGITLAGKGLYDLTMGMNQQTQGTLNPG